MALEELYEAAVLPHLGDESQSRRRLAKVQGLAQIETQLMSESARSKRTGIGRRAALQLALPLVLAAACADT